MATRDGGRRRLDAALEQFFEFLLLSGRGHTTARTYVEDVKKAASWMRTRRQDLDNVSDMTLPELSAYRAMLLDDYRPATVNRKLTSVRLFLKWASSLGMLGTDGRSAIRSVSLPVESRSNLEVLTLTQRKRIMAVVLGSGSPRDRAILSLLINFGLRVSELCRLQWKDLDLSQTEARVIIRGLKAGSVRTVLVDEATTTALQDLRQHSRAPGEKEVFSATRRPIEFLLARYARVAGLTGVTPKVLRQSYLRALAKTENRSKLPARFGRTTDSATLQPYSGVHSLLKAEKQGSPAGRQLRNAVLLRAANRCERCGANRDYADFLSVVRLPGCKGAASSLNTLVALCPNCSVDAIKSPERERIAIELRQISEVTRKDG